MASLFQLIQKKNVIVMVCVSLLCCACAPDLSGVLTIAPTPAPGTMIYQDDFENPDSGWNVWNEESGSNVAYRDGGLRFFINEPQYDYWSRPGKRMDDVLIEVDAAKLSGPDDNDFGIICRFRDRDNFYAFLISSDGYGGILKVKDGNYEMISAPTMQYQEIIRRGVAGNHLAAACIGPALTFFVNDERILSASDTDHTSGEFGLMVGSYMTPGVDVFFDNFKVFRP